MNDDELGRLYRDAIDTVPGGGADAARARSMARRQRRTHRVAAATTVAAVAVTGLALLPRAFDVGSTVAAPTITSPTAKPPRPGTPATASTPPSGADDPDPGPAQADGETPGTPDRPGLLVGSGTVLDDGSGPVLCVGPMPAISVPRCSGRRGSVPLRGWTWPKDGVSRRNGTTSGRFAVVGRYDGKTFTVDRTVDPEAVRGPKETDVAPSCPTPAGGWPAPVEARTTDRDLERVVLAAERLPGYGDTRIRDRDDGTPDARTATINVSVTRDLDGAERTLRKLWGGRLCVTRAKFSHARVTEVQERVSDLPGVLTTGSGGYPEGVEVDIVFDDGTLQRELDTTYGAGLVRVRSALRAYPQ